jgi:antirestriction protein
MQKAVKKCGESDEFIVSDYEGFPSLDEFYSFDRLKELSDFAEWAINEDPVWGVIEAFWVDYSDDISEIIRKYDDGYYTTIDAENSEYDLGYSLISELYGNDIPDDLIESYFDYDSLEKDLEMEGFEESEIEEIMDDSSMLDKETAKKYFDYEAYGRDLEIDGFSYMDNNMWVKIL